MTELTSMFFDRKQQRESLEQIKWIYDFSAASDLGKQ